VDQFYQDLRKIQKKERNNGTLARVEETFYNQLQEYIDELKQEAMSDPFSNAHTILKQAQIIATEICQRREKKITEAAVVNIHRSYHLFTGKPQFDLVDTTPLNLTPEEEQFYYSLIDTLKNHRINISLEKLSDDDAPKKPIIRPKVEQTNTLTSDGTVKEAMPKSEKASSEPAVKETEPKAEETVADVKPDSQVKVSAPQHAVKKPAPKPPVREVKPQVKPKPKVGNIEDNPNALDNHDEFYDLESRKVARDTELVTMLVFDNVGAIVGVDEKIYGPFRPQDIVTLPLVNAKIFFKNRKGRQVKI
jgi:DNA replication factor GINS